MHTTLLPAPALLRVGLFATLLAVLAPFTAPVAWSPILWLVLVVGNRLGLG